MGDRTVAGVLLDIYQRLIACYGSQHWWPAEKPFEVMVGAILTQSTAWTNVVKAIEALKSAGVLSPAALRHLLLPELSQIIYPCGYYNTKSLRLKALVNWLGEHYDDHLERLLALDTATLRYQLLELDGVGPETADTIILYAVGRPVFVIDAYTRRIISRLGLAPTDNSYAAYQSYFMQNLPADVRLFNEYHALLVRLAKDVCRRRSRCWQCCLKGICRSGLDLDAAQGED